MVYGGGSSISDYQSFVYNYTLGQFNYKIPITLPDVQLYVPLSEWAAGVPGSQSWELIHTCGSTAGTVESITPSSYVAGTDPNGDAYMVISGFAENTTAECFVIAGTLDGNIWFSQEYGNEAACGSGGGATLNYVLSCYGNLDPKISFDREGIYFGQSQGSTAGDSTVTYQHRFLMRQLELTIAGIRNEFKQGRTRTFRSESTDLYLFWGELIPEWYLKHIDAVFKRGEVEVGIYHGVYSFDATHPISGNPGRYLVSDTNYEKADECLKSWKPSVTLKENFYNSFSCEPDPCTFNPQTGGGGGENPNCCDPQVTNATVTPNGEGGQTVCVNFIPCSPAPSGGWNITYRIVGSGGGFVSGGNFSSSPACFGTADPDGTNYEGYIQSICPSGNGALIYWSTGSAETYSITSTPCTGSTLFTEYTISGGTPGDIVTVHISFSGFMVYSGTNNFMRANFSFSAPGASPSSGTVSSPCIVEPGTTSAGFTIGQDIVITMAGSTYTFSTSNVAVDNSSGGSQGFGVTITDVNGNSKSISTSGCHGNSSTGGTC